MYTGKNSFLWLGTKPRVNIIDPELIKDVFNRIYDFPKPNTNPLIKLLVAGVANHEGEKWSKHRRIINPAFNLEKLKVIVPLLDIDLIWSTYVPFENMSKKR